MYTLSTMVRRGKDVHQRDFILHEVGDGGSQNLDMVQFTQVATSSSSTHRPNAIAPFPANHACSRIVPSFALLISSGFRIRRMSALAGGTVWFARRSIS